MTTRKSSILKFVIGSFVFLVIFIVSSFFYLSHFDEELNGLNDRSMRRIVRDKAEYQIPADAEILYKVNYWGSSCPFWQATCPFTRIKPRSLCFVLRFTEEEIEKLHAHKFKETSDYEGFWASTNPVENHKGCANYKKYPDQSFEKIADFCQGPTGARIFVNRRENIVMFEPYLFD